MIFKLGIIPAAGKAERFGGVYKELLPIENSGFGLLQYAYETLENVGAEVVIVTNREKIAEHARAMRMYAIYLIQSRIPGGMWGAILDALVIPAKRYYFIMPDTCVDILTFDEDPGSNFVMGTFRTILPERYGMIRGDRVVNKIHGEPGVAWGVLAWSKKVRDYWLNDLLKIENYTDAINLAMKKFGYKTFPLKYYYDIATFGDYKAFIRKPPK